MREVSMPCGVCAGTIRLYDTVCSGCGRAVTQVERSDLQTNAQLNEWEAGARGQAIQKASRTIAFLAILFALSGVVMYFVQKHQADEALARLSEFQDEEVMEPIDGETYTAGQLRVALNAEVNRVLIVYVILTGLMGGLWFWARRAPLPAIASALALFLVVQLVGGILDPGSIHKGILIKILALAALGKGLKSALAARAALRQRSAI